MARVGHAVLAAAMMAAMGTARRGGSARRHLSRHDGVRQAAVYRSADARGHRGHNFRRRCALQSCGAVAQHAVEATAEQGTGTIDGQKINLQGDWKSGSRQYEAKYSGSFVRRSAKLKGTQTWTDGGKTVTRACAGAIKRPLKAFLPRDKK